MLSLPGRDGGGKGGWFCTGLREGGRDGARWIKASALPFGGDGAGSDVGEATEKPTDYTVEVNPD